MPLGLARTAEGFLNHLLPSVSKAQREVIMLYQRFWIYQRERFPLVSQGLLIGVISLCSVGFSVLLRSAATATPLESSLPLPQLGLAVLVAMGCALGFFFQMRVADEYKDYDTDLQYRPYRPVQRGLITLRELAWLAGGMMVVQLGLSLWLDVRMVLPLLLVWGYMGLMRQEFFVRDWLRRHAVAYMLSHLVIAPLIFFYITACDWLVAGATPTLGLVWFLATAFFNGMFYEIGRKIRAPQNEETGVETYSQLWGRPTAIAVWWLMLALAGVCAAAAAFAIHFFTPVIGLVLLLLLITGWLGVRFLQQPRPASGGTIQSVSALAMMALYLGLGVLPFVVSRY
jgi:4-hydroxybenzoate polyprenyltransferase